MSFDGWMDKDNVVWNIIQAFKQKKGNPTIYNNMDGPWGYYAKSEKDKYCYVWSHLHVKSDLKKQKQKLNTELTYTKNKWVVARGKG